MAVKALVKPNSYYDSVKLMTVTREITQLPGVDAASIAMATPLNIDLLKDDGLATPDVQSAGPNDLVIAVRAQSGQKAQAAVEEAMALLSRRPTSTGAAEAKPPRTLTSAAEINPDINLAIISVPGQYAGIEAEEALRAGLSVLLFSDNVPISEEVRLKRIADELGLLLMGPDCGTAIINGVGLGFANAVRRGPIGVVGASGTGMQQVTCLIDALGSGVSQAIGTGGRDLRADVGGMMMRAAIEALGADEATEVIVLVSKPPAPEVAARILNDAAATGKEIVAIFLGDTTTSAPKGVRIVHTLTEAAECAVDLVRGGVPPSLMATVEQERGVVQARARLVPEQRYVRGLFSGGTLCEEALLLLSERIGPAYSNIPLDPELALRDPLHSQGHVLVDLGSDEFTVGRAHPMIDPTLRNEWIRRAAADPTVACLLVDVVLGYGAHPDPAGTLVPVLADIRRQVEAGGRVLPIIISLCAAEGDPQGLSEQERILREAGAFIYRSNAAAALAAATLIAKPGDERQPAREQLTSTSR